MPLEEVIAGYTFQGFVTTPPVIPGLQALGIFGTTKDGINGNRAPGGPAFANLTNPPVIGTTWITVNNGTATSTPTFGFDSGVFETSATLASGWTMFAVARYTPATGNATMVSIGPGQASALILNPQNNSISNHPSVYWSCQGLVVSGGENTLDLLGNSLAAWRMYAWTYPAGAGVRPYTMHDVTGAVSKTSTATHNRVLVGTTNRFTFGNMGAVTPANCYQFCDVAVGGFCIQPLSLAQLQTVRTWLLGVLAARGVTGF